MADVAQKIPMAVAPRHAVVLNPAELAIVAAQAVVHAETLAAVEGTGIDLDAALQVLRMHALGPPVSEFPIEGATREIQPRLVEVVAFLVGFGGPDQSLAGVRQGTVLQFAL